MGRKKNTSCSEETRSKISETMTGRVLSESHRKSIVMARSGTTTSAETKFRIANRPTVCSGINHPHAKLNESTALDIFRRYTTGLDSQRSLAIEYKISRSTVQGVIRGDSWGYVTGVPNTRRKYRTEGLA